jgi:hypothetical protein
MFTATDFDPIVVGRVRSLLKSWRSRCSGDRNTHLCTLLESVSKDDRGKLVRAMLDLSEFRNPDSRFILAFTSVLFQHGGTGNICPKLFSEIADFVLSSDALFAENVRVREASLQLIPQLCLSDASVLIRIVKLCTEDVFFRSTRRTGAVDDRKQSGTEAVLGYPDAEGWGSLETSLKVLCVCARFLNQSHRAIVPEVISALEVSANHTNRFAREQAHLCMEQIQRIRSLRFIALDNEQTIVAIMCSGLKDNWSQVRYAALMSLRVFIRNSIYHDRIDCIDPDLLPLLLVNRHYVAEGVRRHAQESWRIMFGSQGGVQVIRRNLGGAFELLMSLSELPNQTVREAVISVLYELLRKVFVEITAIFEANQTSNILKLCIDACEDEAWPIREIGSRCVAFIYSRILRLSDSEDKELLVSKIPDLVNILSPDIYDAMLPMREGASETVAVLIACHVAIRGSDFDSLWHDTCRSLESSLSYLRSRGSQPRLVHETSLHENRPMYSCGSLLANTSRRRIRLNLSDECCSSSAGCNQHSVRLSIDTMMDGAFRFILSLLSNEHLNMDCKQQLRDIVRGNLPEIKMFRESAGFNLTNTACIDIFRGIERVFV